MKSVIEITEDSDEDFDILDWQKESSEKEVYSSLKEYSTYFSYFKELENISLGIMNF